MNIQDIKIGILGSGNVAHHLAHAFYFHPEINFNSLYTRNSKTGRVLADAVQVSFVENLEEFVGLNDLIIICASDDSIDDICKHLKGEEQIIAHTSGVVSINVLKQASQNYGSFYPLQTFTKTRDVDLKEVPFLIDASNKYSQDTLEHLARLISKDVRSVNDEQRRKLHVAAVIVNNFSNHLFALTKDYTDKLGLDFDILKPLMQETVMKALAQNPKDIQTGPAKRKDTLTIEQHLNMLEDPKLKELYLWFTESIGKYYE
jgi:predicted short-subunit dehydrogenase-like oxidoreductase (DUF2520 family)